MIKEVQSMDELMLYINDADGDEKCAYDCGTFFYDYLETERFFIHIRYNTDVKLFQLYGDIKTILIDCEDMREVFNSLDDCGDIRMLRNLDFITDICGDIEYWIEEGEDDDD